MGLLLIGRQHTVQELLSNVLVASQNIHTTDGIQTTTFTVPNSVINTEKA